jgi:hypothetical protein
VTATLPVTGFSHVNWSYRGESTTHERVMNCKKSKALLGGQHEITKQDFDSARGQFAQFGPPRQWQSIPNCDIS